MLINHLLKKKSVNLQAKDDCISLLSTVIIKFLSHIGSSLTIHLSFTDDLCLISSPSASVQQLLRDNEYLCNRTCINQW